MVASCSNVAENTTGRKFCDILSGLGNGIGVFLEAILDSWLELLIVGAVVVAVVAFMRGITGTLGRSLNRR